MKKLLLVLLCVPLMFSCGENQTDGENQKDDKIKQKTIQIIGQIN